MSDEIGSLDVSETSSEITGDWSYASDYQLARAVRLSGCTGTRVAWNWVVTALHCDPRNGEEVRFYDDGPEWSSREARIEDVRIRPGTSADDTWDNDLVVSDYALVRLESLNDSEQSERALQGPVAVLAWEFPGDGVRGKKVGSGKHGGFDNPDRVLKQVADTIDDTSDSDGAIWTSHDDSNPGDSGGPFYVDNRSSLPPRVAGVLWGWSWSPGDLEYNRYTSMSRHLDFSLRVMDYRWDGMPALGGTRYNGTTVDLFPGTHRVCQYACEKTRDCHAYVWSPTNMCRMVSNITSVTSDPNVFGALHFGASSARVGPAVGWVRSDGINSIVYVYAGRVREAWLDGGWHDNELSTSAPAATGSVSPYVRADGINAIIYRSDNRIIELYLDDGWHWRDLIQLADGAPAPTSNAVAYVRADGISAVVYRGTDSKIHELRFATRGWRHLNLTADAGSSVLASDAPHAYRRSDGYSSVLFRSGTSIYELYARSGSEWSIGNLSATGAPAADSQPFGYTHANGTNAVVYRTRTYELYELWLDSSGWRFGELVADAPLLTGDPMAYVRTDGKEAVMIRNHARRIYEFANAPWTVNSLSSASGDNTSTVGTPSAYIRTDGYNSVVFEAEGSGALHELYWKRGMSSWAGGAL